MSGILVVCLYINNEGKRSVLENFCFVSLANLTGHEDEKVGLENFELLKVLGTGGNELLFGLDLCRFLCKSCANLFTISCVVRQRGVDFRNAFSLDSLWKGFPGSQTRWLFLWKFVRYESPQEGYDRTEG